MENKNNNQDFIDSDEQKNIDVDELLKEMKILKEENEKLKNKYLIYSS